jgi:Protein tyrosine and serine/threonine kinase
LQGQTSQKSDVFSFSTTVWEIFSNGALPYTSLTNKEVTPIVLAGETRQYLETPLEVDQTELSFEDSIWPGWSLNPEDRPSMSAVREWLEDACGESLEATSPAPSRTNLDMSQDTYGFTPSGVEMLATSLDNAPSSSSAEDSGSAEKEYVAAGVEPPSAGSGKESLYSSMPSEVQSSAVTPGSRDTMYASMPARAGEDDSSGSSSSSEASSSA